MVRLLRAVSLGLLLNALIGCFGSLSPHSELLTRLDARGPVLLSPDNPFLVGNLALAREMDNSPVLRGFVAHRGSPPALEVTHSFFSPYRIILYYPDKSEQYSFEPAGSEWITDGPAAIEREKLKDLILLTRNSAGAAKLLSGDEPRSSFEGSGAASSEPEKVAESAERESIPAEEPKKSGITPFQSPSVVAPTGGLSSEREVVAKALATGSHPAEITAKGDLVHYVTFPGESLSLIARWYTYDRANAGRLARINEIKDPNSVTVGDTIIIPAYLVRNKNRLTKEGLDLLKTVAADERRNNAAYR